MSDDDLKRLITETAAETREHFDVVSDGLRHEIRIVAEGVLRNGEKIDETRSELGQRIDRNSEKIDNNRALIQKNADKIDGNAVKIEHLDGSMHKQFDETRSMIRIS